MTPLATAINTALIHFVWQGTLAGLVVLTVLTALRKRSANVRYLVGCAGLAIMVLLPIVTTILEYRSSAPAASLAVQTALVAARVNVAAAGASAPAPGTWLNLLQRWTLPIWSIGVLLLSLRLLWSCVHAFRLGRRGDRADDTVAAMVSNLALRMGIRHRVRVLISTMAEVPSVVGWVRPIILLPAASVLGLTPIQLEAVLAHELAHVRRFDYLVNLLQVIAETLLFYHPMVWWISRRVRIERELCCDDLALIVCGDAVSYARALSTLEKLRIGAPSLAMGSTSGPLVFRIRRILGIRGEERRPSRFVALVAISLGVLGFAVNTNWLRGQTQELPKHAEPAGTFTAAVDFPGMHVDLHGSSIIHRSPVRYPENLIDQGLKGSVTVEVTTDAQGLVTDARVLSGPQEFRKAALQSVLDWHFTHDSANSTRQVTISFELSPDALMQKLSFKARELEETAATLERPFTAVMLDGDGTERGFRVQLRTQSVETGVVTGAVGGKAEVGPPPPPPPPPPPLLLEGRTVSQIRVLGLPSAFRDELLARLPVKLGDKLSSDLIQEVSKVVHEFDEHLDAAFIGSGNNQAQIRVILHEGGPGGFIRIRRPE